MWPGESSCSFARAGRGDRGPELCRLGWREPELATRRKNVPVKLAIAARLRSKETGRSTKSIGALAHLVTCKSANARFHERIAQVAPAEAQGQISLCDKTSHAMANPIFERR